jgi:hypothetical protein
MVQQSNGTQPRDGRLVVVGGAILPDQIDLKTLRLAAVLSPDKVDFIVAPRP